MPLGHRQQGSSHADSVRAVLGIAIELTSLIKSKAGQTFMIVLETVNMAEIKEKIRN